MRTIDGHTFDEGLVTGDGWIIDAGCRGFAFSHYTGGEVYALDIEDLSDELPTCTVFKHAALSHKKGTTEAYYFGNGTGNFLKGINDVPYNGPDRPCETKEVELVTLDDIYSEIGTNIDLLKLDIEGSEYEILAYLEPIPKQVTVEFHEHCHTKLHNEWIDKVLNHMSKNYQLFQNPCPDWPRYKYMDCLFIRKDLL